MEQRYSQTEREALAIVWAVERFHTYLYGGHFTLYTDCKPVKLIFNNKRSQPPARIERWNLHLQEYNFTTVYTKGIENPSDFLSRHPSKEISDNEEQAAELYVNFIATHATPNAMTLSEIKQATKDDATLQKVIELIHNNNWKLTELSSNDVDIEELKQFSKIKEELTVTDTSDLILRRNRTVIPKTLCKQTLSLAHEGHQGIVKTKQLIREKVWFPKIDHEVQCLLSSCLACQANGSDSKPDPLTMSSLPPEPWHTVHIDFCGPFPTGEHLLVVIDAYSRFPEVDVVHSTKATSTISKLECIFATHGIPRIIKSDNGPPFTSHEFHSYTTEIGAKHQKITPLWPQANSEAENFMKPLTKAICSAYTEKKNWKKEIYTFLLNYRATPHTTTGFPPSELLFNRKIRTKLPQVTMVSDQSKDEKVRKADELAKSKMKCNADKSRQAKTSNIQIGDTVLLRQKKMSKVMTKFDPHPFKVIRMKGTMISVTRNGKYVTRNASLFKPVKVDTLLNEQRGECEDRENGDLSDNDDSQIAEIENLSQSNGNSNTTRRYSVRERRPLQRYIEHC